MDSTTDTSQFESQALDWVELVTAGDPCLPPGTVRQIVQACLYVVPRDCICTPVTFWDYYDVNRAISMVASRKLTIAVQLVTSTAAPGSAPGDAIARRWQQLERQYSGTHAG